MLGHRPVPRSSRTLALVLLLLSGVACDSLLEVDDPTSIEEAEARSTEFAEEWARGSRKMVSQGWDGMLALLSIASDELRFEGPHTWWRPLDRGEIDSPGNDGLQEMFLFVAAAYGMAEEAVEVLDSLAEADTASRSPLARAHLAASIISATIADGLEDFAPSDGPEPGPPLGPAGMGALYAQAVEHATRGLSGAEGDDVLRRDMLAARARAAHAAQVWARIRPPPADVSGDGLVSSSDAAADALAALALDGSDWEMRFDFPATAVRSRTLQQLTCSISNYRPGNTYATATGPNADDVVVNLFDPIDGVPDPTVGRVLSTVLVFVGQCGAGSLPVVSAREMRLIVAEHALAQADTTGFAEQVNLVRAAEGLSPWSVSSGVTAGEMLIHERRVRLYLTGRRLADMYRFGLKSDAWDASSVAATLPGTLYPIAQSEIDVNCYLNGSCR